MKKFSPESLGPRYGCTLYMAKYGRLPDTNISDIPKYNSSMETLRNQVHDPWTSYPHWRHEMVGCWWKKGKWDKSGCEDSFSGESSAVHPTSHIPQAWRGSSKGLTPSRDLYGSVKWQILWTVRVSHSRFSARSKGSARYWWWRRRSEGHIGGVWEARDRDWE